MYAYFSQHSEHSMVYEVHFGKCNKWSLFTDYHTDLVVFSFFCSLFSATPSSLTILSAAIPLGRWQTDTFLELSEIWPTVILTPIVFIHCRATKVWLRSHYSEIVYSEVLVKLCYRFSGKIWLIPLGLQFFLLTLTLICWEVSLIA